MKHARIISMSRPPINSDSIYHIYNRGVEKRNIFMNDGDRFRFVLYLNQLNSRESIPNQSYFNKNFLSSEFKEVGPPQISTLVDILAFALMPNHYHLMVRQRDDGGISQFMQKLGTAYTMFFNEKHSHSGVLFQGKYKYKAVVSDAQLLYLPHYIHLNPLGILGGPTSLNKLEQYRWSSYPDYIGNKNFSSVIEPREILNIFGGSEAYQKDLKGLAKARYKHLDEIESIALDWRV